MAAKTIEEWLWKKELKFEDKYPKKYITTTAGDGLRIKLSNVLRHAILGFFQDLWCATKAIYREVA